MSLSVKCYPRGPFGENTYLITDDKTGRCAVIDPGYIGDDILSDIDKCSGLEYILLTHGHYDHFAACPDYLNSFPAAVFAAPADDTELMYNGTDNRWFANGSPRCVCPEASVLVREDDIIRLGETEIRVIGTPGHTAGGITFYADNFAFTGDTLFRLSVGVTNYKTGNKDTMYRSIQSKLYALPDDTVICPGHGAATTIAYEKQNNPFVKAGDTGRDR